MELITCPSTEDFVSFRGGMIAVRAAAYIGPARGTLSEVVSGEAMSGSYVEDTQEVPWGGVNHFETPDIENDADDTLVIDPTTLPLEPGFWYYPFVTFRMQGTAAAGDGRKTEQFWYYDPFVFYLWASDDDFDSNIMVLGSFPRHQSQFSLLQLSGNIDRFIDPANDWRFRAAKRDTSGGDVALQIEQVILVPYAPAGTGRYTPNDFVFGNLSVSDEVVETAIEASLESGQYTLDTGPASGQPRGDGFDFINDLQDNDGSDPEVSAEAAETPAQIGTASAVFHIGGGIVHVPKAQIEEDLFNRSITPENVSADGDLWGDSPYGFDWFWIAKGVLLTGGGLSPTLIGVNGSEGVIEQLGDFTVTDRDSMIGMKIGTRNVEYETGVGAPVMGDARDVMIEAEVSWSALPDEYFEVSVGQFDGTPGLDVGYSSWLVAQVLCEPDGSLSLFFNRWYYSQAGTSPPGPGGGFGDWANEDVDQDWGGPVSLGSYTPNDILHIKFARRGYNVYARAWFDGDTEPSAWDLTERIQVPYLSGGTVFWDDYDYPQGDTLFHAWRRNGIPGVFVETAFDNQATGIDFACYRFQVDWWQDEDADFDPTDVFLRVNETGSATVIGPELNMGSLSQNWVLVKERSWPDIDVYQWNDEDSIPLQWMSTGTTYYRRYHALPQIYRRPLG